MEKRLWLGFAILLCALAARGADETVAFKLIVNASNPVRALSPEAVSGLFLRRGRWEDGTAVVAADLHPDSPVRERFSGKVHGRDVAAVKSYWNKMIFAGKATPPPEFATDEEVVAFVRGHAGAIGYVAKSTDVGGGVRIVPISPGGARVAND